MDLREKTVLSFDCYGTLIDWERGLLASLSPLYDRSGRSFVPSEALAAFARHESRVQSGPYQPYRQVLREVLVRIAEEDELTIAPSERDLLSDGMVHWRPFADTVGALRSLGARCAIVIISNVDRELFASAARSLEVDLAAQILAEDVRAYKPSPAMFEAARRELTAKGLITQHDTARWLHCAQSLFHDVAVAHALGIDTVHVTRQQESAGAAVPSIQGALQADLVVDDLAQLAAQLDAAFASNEPRPNFESPRIRTSS